MTICIYSSSFIPYLNHLASHGKTRMNANEEETKTTTSTHDVTTTTATIQQPERSGTVAYYLHTFLHSQVFLIPKKHFKHFYTIGIIYTSILFYTYTQMMIMTMTTTSVSEPPEPIQRYPSILSFTKVSIVLLYIHLFRRWYECSYVHIWKESSVMHLAGYLVGLTHYILLPHVFLRLPCETIGCSYHSTEVHPLLRIIHYIPQWLDEKSLQQSHRQMYATTLFDTRNMTVDHIRFVFAVGLCVFGQYQQYRHHALLANLRKHQSNTGITQSYSLPTSGWFHYVTCPHYFAEIIIYISFALMLEEEKYTDMHLSNSRYDYFYYYGYRHVILVLWVASNVTLSAIKNHEWYTKHLNVNTYQLHSKKAIVPFIL